MYPGCLCFLYCRPNYLKHTYRPLVSRSATLSLSYISDQIEPNGGFAPERSMMR